MKLPEFAESMPQAGVAIDRKDVIELKGPVERPCIALRTSAATVLISRPLLEALSAHADVLPNDDANRIARIRGGRAKALLDAASGAPDPDGHVTVDPRGLRQGSYLVGDLLRSGLVEVIPSGSSTSATRIAVHYWGTVAGPTAGFGRIHYLVESAPRPAAPEGRIDPFADPNPPPGASGPGGQPFSGQMFYSTDWWVR